MLSFQNKTSESFLSDNNERIVYEPNNTLQVQHSASDDVCDGEKCRSYIPGSPNLLENTANGISSNDSIYTSEGPEDHENTVTSSDVHVPVTESSHTETHSDESRGLVSTETNVTSQVDQNTSTSPFNASTELQVLRTYTNNESQTAVVPAADVPSFEEKGSDNATIVSVQNNITESLTHHNEITDDEENRNIQVQQLPSGASAFEGHEESRSFTPASAVHLVNTTIVKTSNESSEAWDNREQGNTVPSNKSHVPVTVLSGHDKHSNESQRVVSTDTNVINQLERNASTTQVSSDTELQDEEVSTQNESETTAVPGTDASPFQEKIVDRGTNDITAK
ncbi:hypothetical protein HPB48_011120 [Haemaphysalis longicornis]|uniref:Uncharacterized protein n=1 Tax=Haemaphysalis longicornis TaxID=44386 RepID=A0A9J6GTC9_HAELO|nr:hypothetical protein HPB48_011120 [Haemaphysalis longicornis]